MKSLSSFIGCALLAFAMSAGAVQGMPASDDREIRIELLPNVKTIEGVVRLGEIAHINTGDLAAIRQLVSLPLGRSPRFGAAAIVRRETLARWIGSRLNLDVQAVRWSGAEESRIESVPQQISGTHIERAAETSLKEWLAKHADRFHIEAASETRDLFATAGRVSLTARQIPAGQSVASRLVVWVDVRVNDAFVRSVPVAFRVEAYRSAWVTPHSVRAGAELATSMLEQREVALAHQPADVYSADVPLKEATALRILRTLKAGDALSVSNSRSLPLVSRGEWVTIRSRIGPVAVEQRGQALQDGELGQAIQIKSSAPGTVQTRVVAAGEVEVLR